MSRAPLEQVEIWLRDLIENADTPEGWSFMIIAVSERSANNQQLMTISGNVGKDHQASVAHHALFNLTQGKSI